MTYLLNMRKVTLINPEIEIYAESHTSWPNEIAAGIIKDTTEELAYADMLSGNQVTGLLRMLIKVSGARTIAEIGMFTGLATLAMMESLPADGKIYALEMNTRYRDIALRHLMKSAHFNKFELIFGSARETVNNLPEGLDLVFIDADKDYYPTYYEILLNKLKQGGIMVLDNMFWYGGVLLPSKDRKSKTLSELNDLIQTDDRVENVMLTVRDGIVLLRKV
ncbi:MAG: class I SAM-dependent methyltransferase [Bacteroidetes bacterium]|nr:class I SAM-dependent methyltransferase [Bacteroidota bacterium]MCH8522942.1 class I SAM-dependent methyltransferase [Balneolales bacterium]